MEATRQAAARGPLLPVVVPWLAAALVDVYLAYGGWPLPRWWESLLEVVLFAGAGRVQWGLGRGWLRSPLLPAAVVAIYAWTIYAPKAIHQLVPFLLGLVIALAWILRLASRWKVPQIIGTAVAVLAVLCTRWVDTRALDHPRPWVPPSVRERLAWPLSPPRARTIAASGPAVVIISVDTLRADAAREMETVRRLAARGAFWERAMSTSSWTLPALASLQTGLMPAEHGAACRGVDCQGIFAGVRLLAEALEASGCHAAVVSNPWATSGTGFARGFDVFVETRLNRLLIAPQPAGLQHQDAQHVVDAALRWLGSAPDRGFYLWVHVFDPHLPYLHSEDPAFRALTAEQLRNSFPVLPARREALRAAYMGQVGYVDRQLLRLLDALERRGVLATGVVVFTADHGEEFWDHGGVEHGHSHHGEVVDVPLALVAPGVTPGPRSGVASLIDIAPTIRAAVGLAPGGLDLRAGVPEERVATAWGGLILRTDCSARDVRRRVIARDCEASPGAVAAYDLHADPGEVRPIPWGPGDELVRAATSVAAPRRGEPAEVDRKALRALCYVQ
jgi:arylsulfatase